MKHSLINKDFGQSSIENVFKIGMARVVIHRCLVGNHYEYNRWPYLITLPISWLLTIWVATKKLLSRSFLGKMPNVHSLFFDGLGEGCRAIKEGSASWVSLDVIYNYQFHSREGLSGLVDDFWIGMINAQAVRNRLKLVKHEIKSALLDQYNEDHHDELRIVSLGTGSAQGVVELIAEMKERDITVRWILIDLDQTALDHASQMAEEFGVSDQIEVKKVRISSIVEIARDFKPHVVEMLGLLDYIRQDKAIKLCHKIYQALEPGGVFLTCNVRRNLEMYFLWFVINWRMIYRSSMELAEIAVKAEFDDARVIYEPHGIHGLLIALKD